MKIGDRVAHIVTGQTGIVAGFQKRNSGVLINFSDSAGVLFRWIHIDNLRVISADIK